MPLPVRFVVVLPVRAEFKNGHLPRILVSLARQRSPMDVIIVVNNRSEDAAYRSAVWEDNRQAVDWLSGLFPQPPAHSSGTELFPDQARYIRASRLTLHLLDLTDGHPRNMGLLRQRGLDYAATLTRSHSPADVLVLSADADCLYGPRFCQSLIRSSLDPAARMLVLPMLYVPLTSDRAILRTHARQHIPILLDQVLRQVTGAPRARLGAPQLAARLDLLIEAGGYAHMEDGEDFELGQRLIRLTRPVILTSPSAIVWTADRAVSDGFESGARLAGLRDLARIAHGEERTPLPLEPVENPLAMYLAARGQDPQLEPGLRILVGEEAIRTIRAASEKELWSVLSGLAIPLHLERPAEILAGIRQISGLETVPHTKNHASLRRTIGRMLALVEKHAGCRPAASGPGTFWPDMACRELWIEAAALMLETPEHG